MGTIKWISKNIAGPQTFGILDFEFFWILPLHFFNDLLIEMHDFTKRRTCCPEDMPTTFKYAQSLN